GPAPRRAHARDRRRRQGRDPRAHPRARRRGALRPLRVLLARGGDRGLRPGGRAARTPARRRARGGEDCRGRPARGDGGGAGGAVMALSSSLAGILLAHSALPAGIVIALGLSAGLACGLVNGALVAFLRVQPIVATLVLLTAGRGLAQLLSGGGILTFESPGFRALSGTALLGLPSTFLLAAAAFVLLALLLRGTTLGLHVEAIGDNERAARLCGLRVGAVQLAAYALCGLLAGLACLL